MKYWGRCLLVYLTITAVLYGTNSVAPEPIKGPAFTGTNPTGGAPTKGETGGGKKTSYAPWE